MGSVRISASQATTIGVRPPLRPFSRLAAALALLVVAPVLLLVALAVRVGSHGPVLERHRRTDETGRPYTQLQFRTLMDGGGTAHHALVRASAGVAAQPYAGIGRFLVRTRLHRLPVLFNVIRGQRPLFSA